VVRATARADVILRVVLAAVAGYLLGGLGPAAQSKASPPAIAIIGVDGADWHAIDPMVAAGQLPAFQILKTGGAVGTMQAEPPLLSPIIWTTIATGRRPEDHGVLDFLIDLPRGGQAPVGSDARRTKALWEIFSDAGRPSLVAGWWATWPPDPIRGVIVSDRVALPHMRIGIGELDAGMVHPPSRLGDVAAVRVTPSAIDYASLNQFVPLTRNDFDEAARSENGPAGLYQNRFAHARAALAATRTYGAVAAKLLPAIRPSFVAVYFELVDTISHLFAGDAARRARATASAYIEIDQQIRALAGALDPDALVLVVSDHGFYPATAGIPDDPSDLTSGAAAWHRPYGIVSAAIAGSLAGTRPVAKGPPLGAISPLDIAPTVLTLAGLPVAADMPGRMVTTLTGGSPKIAPIASYGAHRPLDIAATRSGAAAAELQRLRSLGYISGTSSVTARARVNLGELLFRRGAVKEAVAELESALRADPGNQRAGLWLARAYSATSRPDDAARVYDRLIVSAKAAGVDPLVVLAATDLDVDRGRHGAAAERLARVPAALSSTPEILVARGTVAAAANKPAEAERLFRAALAAQPANIEALRRLIDLLLQGGRSGSASQVAVEAARRFPDSAERHALAGETALAARRPAEAARALREALALAPDSIPVRIDLARAELMQNQAERALDALGDVRTHDAEMLRGAAASAKGNWTAAVQAFSRAAADGQPSIELLNALGNAQLEAGRPADAVATLDRSLAIKPDQPEIRALANQARQRVAPANR
jgi:tetratricopeptide (TPR) repeat protein